MELDRRQFIELSTAGAAFVALASSAAWMSGCAPKKRAAKMKVLRDKDVALVRALVPAVLIGRVAGNDASAIERVVVSFDRLLDGLSPAANDLAGQAFDALSFAPTRVAMAGQWSDWSKASVADAQAALNTLRDSRFELVNSVYAALVRLIGSAYYVLPESAASTGYPGPPKKVNA